MIDLHPPGRGTGFPRGHLVGFVFPSTLWVGVGSSPSKVCAEPQAILHCHHALPRAWESWSFVCARSFLKRSLSNSEKLHSPIHSGTPYSRARRLVRWIWRLRSRLTAEMGRSLVWTSRP